MPRPKLCRWVRFHPRSTFFKPSGIPLKFLDEISLSIEELEAIRLADFEGFYQDEAAKRMGVSRQTFGRIITTAHKKIAEILVQGKALRIQGGDFMMIARGFRCSNCGHLMEVSRDQSRPSQCPQCSSIDIFRIEDERGFARGSGFGPGRGARGRGRLDRTGAGFGAGRGGSGRGGPARSGGGRGAGGRAGGGGGGRRRGFGQGRGGTR